MARTLKLVGKEAAEAVFEGADYPRIAPGEYIGYCKFAQWYLDPGFRRWVCLLRFDVLNTCGELICALPIFFNGGPGEHPKAGRRSKFYTAWIAANGGRRPRRGGRMALHVFTRRMARVQVRDNGGGYSIVSAIVDWQTGGASCSVAKA